MTPERYEELNKKGSGLSKDEIANRWHFCREWDLLLIGPGMPEMEACLCFYTKTNCPTCED